VADLDGRCLVMRASARGRRIAPLFAYDVQKTPSLPA